MFVLHTQALYPIVNFFTSIRYMENWFFFILVHYLMIFTTSEVSWRYRYRTRFHRAPNPGTWTVLVYLDMVLWCCLDCPREVRVDTPAIRVQVAETGQQFWAGLTLSSGFAEPGYSEPVWRSGSGSSLDEKTKFWTIPILFLRINID